MKRQKIILILSLFSFVYSFSQKVKFRNGDVLIDDVFWMKYLDCGFASKNCSLVDHNGDEIVYIQKISNNSTDVSYYGITQTYDSYNEVKFLGTKMYFEIKGSVQDIIRALYVSKVINENGELDKERASRLVEKYGTSISDVATNNSTQVVPPPVIITPNYYNYPPPRYYPPSISIMPQPMIQIFGN